MMDFVLRILADTRYTVDGLEQKQIENAAEHVYSKFVEAIFFSALKRYRPGEAVIAISVQRAKEAQQLIADHIVEYIEQIILKVDEVGIIEDLRCSDLSDELRSKQSSKAISDYCDSLAEEFTDQVYFDVIGILE